MLVRSLTQVEQTPNFVEWGNGTSHRMLTKADGMGFTLCHTVVRAGTESLLQYRNHMEACYCIGGSGEVEDMQGNLYAITPGVMFALDKHDRHRVCASNDEDMILVSVFNPPLEGTETHDTSNLDGSSY